MADSLTQEFAEIRDTWGLHEPVLIGSSSQIAQLLNALEAVLALHTPMRVPTGNGLTGTICADCGEPTETEPCATVRAITKALGVDT